MPHIYISDITHRRIKNMAIGRFVDNSERQADGRLRIWVDDEVMEALEATSKNLGIDHDRALNALFNSVGK